jgi:glycosyltransferase involved in cell wall biosynthesis
MEQENQISGTEPLVSVIVPVCNVAAYLREGLDSLLAQTYRNLEIIAVDDGSDDSSPAICAEYARRDARVRLIRQENGGLSAARNTGLDAMHGAYTAFLDPDDAFRPDMIEALLHALRSSGAQIACCDYDICRTEGSLPAAKKHKPVHWKPGVFSSAEALVQLFSGGMGFSVWSKLFDSRLFAQCRFTVGRNYEDSLITPMLFERAERIVSVGRSLVLHRKRPQSITTTASAKNMLDWFYARERTEAFLAERIPAVFPQALLDRYTENGFRGIMKQCMRLLPESTPEKLAARRQLEQALKLRSRSLKDFAFFTRAEYTLYRISPHLCRAVRRVAARGLHQI